LIHIIHKIGVFGKMTEGKSNTKKQLIRLAELVSEGRNNHDISSVLNKEFDSNIDSHQVAKMIKREVMYKKQMISTNEEFKEMHKSTLMTLMNKATENMEILENLRDTLLGRFDGLKDTMPHSQLMAFNKELNSSLRTYNDIIRSTSELLKRMETETTEVKLNQVQQVQETVKILKDLEEAGYITITKDFYKSDLYGGANEKEKEM